MREEIPQDRTFRSQRLRLVDVVDDFGLVEEVAFVNCDVEGPGVVLPDNSQFYDCCFTLPEENLEAILWPPPAVATGEMVYGPLCARSCLFEDCRFHRLGFTGPPQLLDRIRSMIRPR